MEHDFKSLYGKAFFRENGWWVSPWNFVDEAQEGIRGKQVYIHDVTLRDGEQTAGLVFTEDERVRIAEALAGAGVNRIEVGMPIVSEAVRRATRRIMDLNLSSLSVGFARAHKDDINLCVECGLKTVVVEHMVNPYINENVYGLSKEKVIDRVASSILYAKEQGLMPTFMGWDLTRSDDFDYVKEVYQAIVKQTEPYSVTVVDTFGVASPMAASALIKSFRKWLPDTRLEYHVHNDFGLANGAVLAAIQAGAEGVHSAFNGLGERTGNVATEQVAMALKLLCGIDVGLKMEKIMATSDLIAEISKRKTPPSLPVVGTEIFNVETGIATHIIKKLKTMGYNVPFTPFEASVVGAPDRKIVLGKNSGSASIEMYLEEHNLQATSDQIAELVERVKRESIIRKSLVPEQAFKQMIRDVLGREVE